MTSEKPFSSLILDKSIEDFLLWLRAKRNPKRNEKIPTQNAQMNFYLVKDLILALAQKGFKKSDVFHYLKERQYIGGTYQTFLNHLRRSGFDAYFTNPLDKLKETLNKPASQRTENKEKKEAISARELKKQADKTESFGVVHDPNSTTTAEEYFPKEQVKAKEKSAYDVAVLDPNDFT